MEATDTSSILAFAADAETEQMLKGALAWRGAQVRRGDITAAIKTLSSTASPQLLFVDLDGAEFPVGRIHELASVCEFETAVIAVSSNDTARFTRELLACGVSDYLPKPLTASDIRDAVTTALRDEEDMTARLYAGRVIAFAGCGGSGATTLAALTALTAAAQGSYVSVLDLERTSEALPLMLDVEPAVGFDELLDLAAKPDPDPSLIDGVQTRVTPRISVYGYRAGDSLPAPPTAEAVQWLMEQLANRSHLVIVDGLTDTDLLFSVLANADERVLVFEPTLVSLNRVIRRMALLGRDNWGLLVENHTRARKSTLSAEDIRYTLAGREPDVTMPFEPGLPAATNYGLPERDFSKKYRQALDDLTGRLTRPAVSLADTVQHDTQF